MVLAANIVSFAGCILMVAIGLIKGRKKILTVQCIQWALMGTSNLMLGGITGFISDFLSIVRNIFGLKFTLTPAIKGVFIAIQIVLSALFNQNGLIGWLPAIAAVIFTLIVDKNEIIIKLAVILAQLMWMIFDISIQNYTSFIFDIFTIISCCVGIWRAKKNGIAE